MTHGSATTSALATLAQRCSQLEAVSLDGQRRMTASALEVLSTSHLRKLHLGCDFVESDLTRIGELLVGGFPSLEHWSWSFPDRYSSKLLNAAGLKDPHIVRADTSAHKRLVDYVRKQRPGLEVRVDEFRFKQGGQTAAGASATAIVDLYAQRKGIVDVLDDCSTEEEESAAD